MLTAKAFYAKVVGKPHPGYDKSKYEWSLDACNLTAEAKKTLKAQGIGDYIKNKGDDRGDFMTFKRPAMKSDGAPGKPIRVVDNKGQPWDQTKFIGNGSTVNINYAVNDKASGGSKPGIIALQVWEHVPYESSDDGFPVSEGGTEDWSDEVVA